MSLFRAADDPTQWRRTVVLLVAILMAGAAEAGCLRPGSALAAPEPRALIAAVDNGESGREIMAAVLAGDRARVATLLRADKRLVSAGTPDLDLLAVAAARCDLAMVDLLLEAGAKADGTRAMMPLIYGINAADPAVAVRLLAGGASARADGKRGQNPLDAAIMLRAPGAVQLLLDHGADPDETDPLGHTPLSAAIDINAIDIAEILIDRGANIWQIDAAGATVGYLLATPPINREPVQDKIRAQLITRLRAAGFPWPPPHWREGRGLLIAGKWPPAAAGNAPQVPEAIVAIARENEARAQRDPR